MPVIGWTSILRQRCRGKAMNKTLRLLLIEDSADDADLLLWTLRQGGYDLTHTRVSDAPAMTLALDAEPWDLVIADYSLPQFSGLAALQLVKDRDLDVPFIIVSGHIGEAEAVAAMKGGAHDYVMKHNMPRLLPAIERELREAATRTARHAAESRLQEHEVRLSAILSNIPGVVFQLDRSGDGRLRFTYVSEGSEALLGISPELLLEDTARFTQLVDAADWPALDAYIAGAAAELTAEHWEGRIRFAPAGEVRWISVRFSPTAVTDGAVWGEGIMTNITESKLAEQEIRESRRRLSELTSHLERVKEQERTKIAREIHDDIGGNLTAIKIDLLWLAGKIAPGNPVLTEKIRQIEGLVDETVKTTSRIGRDLRPGILDLGLAAAVEWLAEEFENRMDIPCRVVCASEDLNIHADVANALFSIFRESLTNITKHANATCVDALLKVENDMLTLQVEDNGRGIASSDLGKSGSFGLRGMEERTDQLGGTIRVAGIPGVGTRITVRMPIGNPRPSASISPRGTA